MRIEITASFDPTDEIQGALDGVQLTGLGPDGTSEYDITDTDINFDGSTVSIGLEIERSEGKFVSKDEILEQILGELEQVEGLVIES